MIDPMADRSDEPELAWRPGRPRLKPLRLVCAWAISALALLVAAGLIAGAHVNGFAGAFLVAAIIAVLNAVLPPLVAALRLPFTVLSGFLLVLAMDAGIIRLAAEVAPSAIDVDEFGSALLVALVAAAVSTLVAVLTGM